MFQDIQKKKAWKEESEKTVFPKTSKQDVLTMPEHFNQKFSPTLCFKELTWFHKAFWFSLIAFTLVIQYKEWTEWWNDAYLSSKMLVYVNLFHYQKYGSSLDKKVLCRNTQWKKACHRKWEEGTGKSRTSWWNWWNENIWQMSVLGYLCYHIAV